MLGPMTVGALSSGAAVAVGLTRYETVFEASVEADQNNVLEPSVMYEADAQILSGTVFKMWYTQGRANKSICYAESADGITWTRYGSNPLITGHSQSSVFKDGSTYYMFASRVGQGLDLYTSGDGVTWTLDTTDAIAKGGAGEWDETFVANNFIWIEDGTWYMMYEADSIAASWQLGLATSADGRTWVKDENNPVLQGSGPWVKKIGSTYWMWIHRDPASGYGGSEIWRYRSTDLVNWTADPATVAWPRVTVDEGYNTATGQVADIHIVEVGALAYIFHDFTQDGGDTGLYGLGIKLATAPVSIISGDVPSNAIDIPAITGSWYDPHEDIGAAHMAVYQPKGAGSLADSLLRVHGDLGNADLDPATTGVGVSPTWDAVNGWIFNGVDQFIDTGIVPAKPYSMVMVLSNRTGATFPFGQFTLDARFHIDINDGQITYAMGGTRGAGFTITEGAIGMANRTGYKSGTVFSTAVPPWTTTTTKNIWIGGRNDGGAAPSFFADINIQAVAIYDQPVTGIQMEAIYQAILDQL